MIDFHTHILPEMDDGSQSMEESLSMLREEWAQGVDTVILTPHFYPKNESLTRFLKRRDESFQRLQAVMAEDGSIPKLVTGAEVYFFRGIAESDILPELAITGTNLVLVEMPVAKWSEQMLLELGEIHSRTGLIPVVAHVERYLKPNGRHLPDVLAELPVLVQANSSFFLRFGTRRRAMHLLRRGKIHLLGSDCHSMTGRTPNLGAATERIQRVLGDTALDVLHTVEKAYFE